MLLFEIFHRLEDELYEELDKANGHIEITLGKGIKTFYIETVIEKDDRLEFFETS